MPQTSAMAPTVNSSASGVKWKTSGSTSTLRRIEVWVEGRSGHQEVAAPLSGVKRKRAGSIALQSQPWATHHMQASRSPPQPPPISSGHVAHQVMLCDVQHLGQLRCLLMLPRVVTFSTFPPAVPVPRPSRILRATSPPQPLPPHMRIRSRCEMFNTLDSCAAC